MLANKIDIFVVQSLNGLKSDNKKWRNDIKRDQRDGKLKHDLRQRQSLAFLGSLHRSSTRFGANLMIYDVFENLHVSIFHFISPSLSLSIYLYLFSLYFSLSLSFSFFFILPQSPLSLFLCLSILLSIVCLLSSCIVLLFNIFWR